MLWVTLIFMPLIIAYTRWAYQVMAGKVTADYIRENEHGRLLRRFPCPHAPVKALHFPLATARHGASG